MHIDSVVGYMGKRVCISIDDDLFHAYVKFKSKRQEIIYKIFKEKINLGDIKNSRHARNFIFSEMMKPSAFKCFASGLPDQVDLEDV